MSDMTCRYGFQIRVITDKGPEFCTEIQAFLDKKGIKRVAIARYNPGSNGPVERSMRTFKDALFEMNYGYSVENAAAVAARESEESSSQLSAPRRVGRHQKPAKPRPPPWGELFYAAVLADRMTMNATTGMTQYRLLFEKEAILPLVTEVPTWSTLPWETV
ncbi:hypothetical protein N7541_001078 [Penicillium brevicompactum]|uniref:Integrase catalytic domain-containing protein n=1 Tax=Penicillium brevicompactum TaxID=5074 RepID=A0A9W9V397_PENBR|nr:hypothetical protein N7541_001078 [Penicillium brevicompactum]